jgi:hypothetical protein
MSDAAEIPPLPPEEATMEIHKPKPVHSWRELLAEIGVVVIGVCIALAAEQSVEALHWRAKVADAETALRRELSNNLAYAGGQLVMKDCATKYFARMESAVASHRSDTLRQLAAMGPPFTSNPWVVESWTAAINSQIPDHISRDRLASYALAFRRVATEREMQFTMQDHYAEIVGARLTGKPTPEIAYAQLVALDKLKTEHALTVTIANSIINSDGRRLGIVPNPQPENGTLGAEDAAKCEKQLAAIAP